MDKIQIGRIEKIGILPQPVIEFRGTDGEIPGGASFGDFLPAVVELARLPDVHESIADRPCMTAEVLQIRLRDHVGDSKGHAAHAERKYRAVRDLLHNMLGNGKFSLCRSLVALHRKIGMLAFHDIVRLREVDPVVSVQSLQRRKLLIDLEYDFSGGLHDSPVGIIRDPQTAIAVFIRDRDGHKRHIGAQILPVQERHLPQERRHEPYEPLALRLSLIAAYVPAVPGKCFLFRVTFYDLDPGIVHQAAADPDIRQFVPPGRERLVQKLREASRKSVVDPVARSHSHDCLLRCHYFVHICLFHFIPPFR